MIYFISRDDFFYPVGRLQVIVFLLIVLIPGKA